MKKKICVVGGGMNGLITALFLKYKIKDSNITLIEKSNFLGGNFSPLNYENLKFDKGLFIPQYTGHKEFDNFLDILFTKKKFNKFWFKKKDIAGCIYKSKLIGKSAFLNFRKINKNTTERIKNFILKKKNFINKDLKNQSLECFFLNRFGKYSLKYFNSISKKFWNKSLKQINICALKIVHIKRIILFSEKLSLKYKKNKYLDELIAYPNQFNIPKKFLSDKTPSIYPKKYGLYNFIDVIIKKSFSKINIKKNVIINNIFFKKKIIIKTNHGLDSYDYVFWCGHSANLYEILFKKKISFKDQPLPHSTYYGLAKKVNDKGLYWAWDYDNNNDVIRVSFPKNYCKNSLINNKNLIIFEKHSKKKISDLENYFSNYLTKRKIIYNKKDFMLLDTPKQTRPFFIPSMQNLKKERKMFVDLKKKIKENFFLCSAEISKNIFYLDDLLSESYKNYLKIKNEL